MFQVCFNIKFILKKKVAQQSPESVYIPVQHQKSSQYCQVCLYGSLTSQGL